jgi:LytR cell envelope-related transcriptional attenuator
VLVLFVVAAIALVAVGTRPTVSGDAATPPPPTTTSTTAPGTHASTTTTTTVPHSSVTVAVANATETNGLAAHYASVLTAQGWAVGAATDAATTEATSSVYYAAGQQEAAASIATTLGLKPAAVVPLTAAVPVSGVSGDDVVVVIGNDLVPATS